MILMIVDINSQQDPTTKTPAYRDDLTIARSLQNAYKNVRYNLKTSPNMATLVQVKDPR